MVALGTSFDANKVAHYEATGSVWEGRVPVVITKTEILATAAKDGQFLALTVKALDAPYNNQENVIRLNLYNKSPQAVEIAQRQLSSVCHVTGRMQITDADQLLNAPFITMWVKGTRQITDQATGQARNIDTCECRDYMFVDGRTIKEAMAGQAASNPYTPGVSGGPQGGGLPTQQPVHSGATAFGNQPAAPVQNGQGQAGPAAFPSSGAAPQPQGGFAPPSGGFGGPQPGQAPQPAPQAQGGFAPPPAGGGFTPPAGPQAGAGPWNGGGAAPGGFGPR